MRAQHKSNPAGAVGLVTVGFDPRSEQVFAIMSREITTARREMALATAMEAMVDQDISHLPVVDDDNRVVGILSKTDVVRDRFLSGDTEEAANVRLAAKNGVSYSPGAGYHEEAESKTTVADVMSAKVLSVHDNATVADAAQLMVTHRIHGLPVVTGENKLVGFISTMDIAAWVARGPAR